MAIGTDTIAHETTLQYQGETIAILGSGFQHVFPKENETLWENIILHKGLVITEYEANMKPLSKNFPVRNRIISALSEGILVIEAAYRSGTSITVKYAKEQGKKVFALPGRLDDCHGIGVNTMIKEGAILTTQIQDILVHYPQFQNKVRKSNFVTVNKENNIRKEFQQIYQYLKKTPLSIDELVNSIHKDVNEIFPLLTEMEIEGIIFQAIGGKYQLKEI